MFTGLIEETGTIEALGRREGGSTRIRVRGQRIPSELKTGDSVAVNGVCLTALEISEQAFSADLAQETIARTSLTRLASGTIVNLELPTRAGETRLGGHVVQGHVDGVGRFISCMRIQDGEDWWLTIELPEGLDRYVASKGSIAIEGISLTVAAVACRQVNVAILPHTYKATNIHTLEPGDPVNIEVDVLAKYAEKMLAERKSRLTVEELVRAGF